MKNDVIVVCRNLHQIEEETGLTIEQVKTSTVVCPSVKESPPREERDG